jgi:hypothetical protein
VAGGAGDWTQVGIANSPLLVKRIGVPRTDHQEPVWAGRAVNNAAKAAQQADRHEMIVTGSVWDWVSKNDFLAVSCDCGTPSPTIWSDTTIDKIPAPHVGEREGKLAGSEVVQRARPGVLRGSLGRPEEA